MSDPFSSSQIVFRSVANCLLRQSGSEGAQTSTVGEALKLQDFTDKIFHNIFVLVTNTNMVHEIEINFRVGHN